MVAERCELAAPSSSAARSASNDRADRAAELLSEARGPRARRLHPEAAVDGYRQAIEVAEQTGDQRAQAEALRRLAVQHHHRGERDAARELSERSYAIATEIGTRSWRVRRSTSSPDSSSRVGPWRSRADAVSRGARARRRRSPAPRPNRAEPRHPRQHPGRPRRSPDPLPAVAGARSRARARTRAAPSPITTSEWSAPTGSSGKTPTAISAAASRSPARRRRPPRRPLPAQSRRSARRPSALRGGPRPTRRRRSPSSTSSAPGSTRPMSTRCSAWCTAKPAATHWPSHGSAAAIDQAVATGSVLSEAEASRELARLYQMMGRNQEALRLLSAAHRLFSRLDARVDLVDVASKVRRLEDDLLGGGAGVGAVDRIGRQLYLRPLRARRDLFDGGGQAAGAATRASSRRSGWAPTCTTSARSRCPTRSSTSPAR